MRTGLSESDRRFRMDAENGVLTPEEFSHRAHVRLAYVYLAEHDTETACRLMKAAIHTMLERYHISSGKYHETVTRAWMMAVRHFMDRCGEAQDFEAFLSRSSPLLDSQIMLTHYSATVLFSEVARLKFIGPDLVPIPVAC